MSLSQFWGKTLYEILTQVGARPELVSITRPDEALVIGCALSLSSSAFVLRLLQEKRQSDEQFAQSLRLNSQWYTSFRNSTLGVVWERVERLVSRLCV